MPDLYRLHPDIAMALHRLTSDSLTPGRVRSSAVALLEIADAVGGPYDRFWARIAALDSSAPEPSSSWHLGHIEWLRQAITHDSLDLDQHLEALHRLKWGVDIMIDSCDGDLTLADTFIRELEAGARSLGLGLRPVLILRARWQAETGDTHTAVATLARAEAEAADDLSECRACELRESALVTERVDPERALALLDPFLFTADPCWREPGLSLGHAARLAAELGYARTARRACGRGRQIAGADPSFGSALAGHAIATAHRGRIRTAHDMISRRAHWLGTMATDVENFYLFSAAHAVRAARGPHGRHSPLDHRAEEAAERGWALARAFDARSGTSYRTDQLERIMRTAAEGRTRGRIRWPLRF